MKVGIRRVEPQSMVSPSYERHLQEQRKRGNSVVVNRSREMLRRVRDYEVARKLFIQRAWTGMFVYYVNSGEERTGQESC